LVEKLNKLKLQQLEFWIKSGISNKSEKFVLDENKRIAMKHFCVVNLMKKLIVQ